MNTAPKAGATVRAADLLGLSFSALRQQKVRTVLTMVGIVIGTFALVLSLSLGRGVDRAIMALFHEDDRLRKIHVSEKYEMPAASVPSDEREPKGAMSDAKRKRISKALVRTWWSQGHLVKPLVRLNTEGIGRLESLDHVAKVEPIVNIEGKAILDGKELKVFASSVISEAGFLRKRLLAGRPFAPADGPAALVDEYLLYRCGYVSDDDVNTALGRKILLEYRSSRSNELDFATTLAGRLMNLDDKETAAFSSALKRLAALARFLPIPREERAVLLKVFDRVSGRTSTRSEQTYAAEFTIIGVVREQSDDDEKPGPFANWRVQDAEMLLPSGAAFAFYRRAPEHAESGVDRVIVTVDQESAVKDVARRIDALGYNEFSLADFIETVRLNVLMITFATAFVAVVALLVAAIGITNTMIMSVLERTHEIGVMKALGARNRHIQLIFLVEGVVLGVAGSGLGLALGWLASFPGDSIAKRIMEHQKAASVHGTLFAFPAWLVVGVPLLVCLITTLAALYPALRASRVDPVTSLRHE